MEDYFELFQKLLKNERTTECLNKDVLAIGKTARDEVEFLKKSIEKYQMYIKELIRNDEFGLTENYMKLKENNKILQYKNKELQNKIEETIRNATIEKDNSTKHYENQLEIIKNDYNGKIENFKQHNQELLTELHMIQATSAVELDETEKNLKQQLYEINQRLRDELNSSQILRNDLRLLKDESEQYKNWNNKKIVDLKRQLEYAQEQNKLFHLKHNLQNHTTDTVINEENLNQINQEINNVANNNNKNNFKRPPLFRGSRKSIKTAGTPSLIACSEVTPDNLKKPGRKRKLFNSNDLTHLEIP